MPAKREDMEAMVAACPGFGSRWKQFLTDWQDEEELPFYLGIGDLAHYVVEGYEQGNTSEFPNLFSVVEAQLSKGDPELNNLIVAGLFEDIQNISSHRTFSSDVFHQWLGPQSRDAWDGIEAGMKEVAEWAERRRRRRWWQFWKRRPLFDAERALAEVKDPELRKILERTYPRRP